MGLFGGGNNGDESGGGIPMNPGARTGLMCLVSGYVMYLGFTIIKGYIDGEAGMPGWVAILFGSLFIILGGLYLVYNIKNYMAIQKAAQESSDDEEETAAEEETPAEEDAENDGSAEELPENTSPEGEALKEDR